jgi:hypothetical protein
VKLCFVCGEPAVFTGAPEVFVCARHVSASAIASAEFKPAIEHLPNGEVFQPFVPSARTPPWMHRTFDPGLTQTPFFVCASCFALVESCTCHERSEN